MPLVLDDALITSDDERAANILRALARFAEGGQVMLFTDHGHLIDAARATSGEQALAVHSLQDSTVPEISRFLGIVITMYFSDHNPPHFHVRHEEYRALIGIEPLELREGRLPARVLGLVMEWGEMHQAELMENWTTLAEEGNFRRIAPLV